MHWRLGEVTVVAEPAVHNVTLCSSSTMCPERSSEYILFEFDIAWESVMITVAGGGVLLMPGSRKVLIYRNPDTQVE